MERKQPVLTGITVALVGFGGSFAVVVAGLQAVGATADQAASGLIALCIAQALGMLYLAYRYRRPLTLAWSTPGAALMVTTGQVDGGWSAAVGAFVVVGGLILVTALWPWLGRTVASIPRPIAQAMLAGVLFSLCLAPVRAVVEDPLWIAPLILLWLLLFRWVPAWSAPVVFLAALVLISVEAPWGSFSGADFLPRLEPVMPEFTIGALLGLALPLYLVTMASQNVPGSAVISSYGYEVPWRASLTVTGLGTTAGAVVGGHAVNLAAITAALAASPESHQDPHQRWRAAATAGWAYLVLAGAAAALVLLVSHGRPGLVETVAGLALLSTLGASLSAAVSEESSRIPAAATFLIAASGVTVFGIGAAFWALAGGMVLWAVLARPKAAA
ncbi:benzoate/H(+) symporter BenE family transporter [Nesterenkonia flava]|uniref:Benzoate/H(+) symporter BenE family transporter n=1 Tax=Nesterenkonia flava TaxID=469799 RepID=A0ABU1FT08_9MICC|nr:benzoate/H(+) symporter BenE family transporter [Nesterenkonia flava]MDR5711804.1 benzoate/H(+) symporter BenE family transporter [Nesterenkonia flava]